MMLPLLTLFSILAFAAALAVLHRLFDRGNGGARDRYDPPLALRLFELLAQLRAVVLGRRIAPVLASLAVVAAWASFLLAPGTAHADTGTGSISQLGAELIGLGIAAVVGPLVAVLAHKYLPELEQKADAAIDASPFFKAHSNLADFSKLFCHHVDLAILDLTDKVVADAKAEGRFDAQLASKVKSDAIGEALLFCGQQNRDELAKALGFTIPGMVDDYLNKLLEARLATLKSMGAIKPVTAAAAAPAPVAAVP